MSVLNLLSRVLGLEAVMLVEESAAARAAWQQGSPLLSWQRVLHLLSGLAQLGHKGCLQSRAGHAG